MVDQVTRIKELFETKKNDSRVIAIASGKGGVGKSNVAVNIGVALVQKGLRVLVIDADTNLANVDVLLGMNPRYNLLHHVLDDMPLRKIIARHAMGLDVMPSASGNKLWRDLEDTIKSRFIKALFQLRALYDYVILDTAAGLAPLSIDLAVRADEVVLVSTSEPTSISDTYAMIKILDSIRKDIPAKLLLNMVTSTSEVADVYQRLSLVLSHFLDIGIGLAGYISFDEHVKKAVHHQKPFVLAYPDCTASGDVKTMADVFWEDRLVTDHRILSNG